MKPFVGLPADVEHLTCSYSPDLDRPQCEASAVLHLAVDSEGWGVVGLLACSRHLAIARATGAVLAEHDARDECRFLTGKCWS